MEKFSYSKVSTMDTAHGGCPYKYKLIYIDKHFINEPSIATDVGTLIHETEESIFNQIKDSLFGVAIDYDFLKNNIKEKFKEIEARYPEQIKEKDKSDRLYKDKIKNYLEEGIYRLEKYFTDNSELVPVAAEKEFNLEYEGYEFHGFIDRIFYDKNRDKYIIEDIKSYAIPVKDADLKTPLQFVIYSLAISEMYQIPFEKIECHYDLPFCLLKQDAGSKGYMDRGIKKLNKLLLAIQNNQFEPSPTPLCHWCVFSETYINGQPEEAKGLCPYFCHWTKKIQKMSVEHEWMGFENHEAILEAYRNKNKKLNEKQVLMSAPIEIKNSDRIFILRR